MIRIAAVAAALLAVAGCAERLMVADAATAAAIDGVRQAADIEARALKAAPCKMTVGAWLRLENPVDRAAIAALCER